MPQSSLAVTAHRLHLPEFDRKPSLSSFPAPEDINRDCTSPSTAATMAAGRGIKQVQNAAEGDNLLPSVPGNSPCHAVNTPGEFCAPQQQPPLYWRKEHATGFFPASGVSTQEKEINMSLLQTAQPKRTQKDPTGKIRDNSVGVSPLLPLRNDQHKHDYINKK